MLRLLIAAAVAHAGPGSITVAEAESAVRVRHHLAASNRFRHVRRGKHPFEFKAVCGEVEMPGKFGGKTGFYPFLVQDGDVLMQRDRNITFYEVMYAMSCSD